MTQRLISQFEVLRTFYLKSQALYVVEGRILTGTFRAGQVGYFVQQPNLTWTIQSIEFALHRTPSFVENPALVFSELNAYQKSLFEQLDTSSRFVTRSLDES